VSTVLTTFRGGRSLRSLQTHGAQGATTFAGEGAHLQLRQESATGMTSGRPRNAMVSLSNSLRPARLAWARNA
jgi:hypothetical protein